MNKPLAIDYYNDILCVWAWIAERRNEELVDQWAGKIDLHPRFINLFGDTQSRMENQWADRGGYEGFAKHVLESAAPYDNAPVHPDIWKTVRPTSSANAHLILKAAEKIYSKEQVVSFSRAIRHGFFVETRDIGKVQILQEIAGECGLDPRALVKALEDGTASAALMRDYQMAHELHIKGSPTWIMNSGRQILFGNVGFRVLNANIREILEHPDLEASWC